MLANPCPATENSMRQSGPRRLSFIVSVLLALSSVACGGRKSLVAGTGSGGAQGNGAAGTGIGTGGNVDGGPAADGPSSTGAAGSGGAGGGAGTGNAGAPAGSGGAGGSAGAGGGTAMPTLTRIEIAPPMVTLAQGTTISVTVTD